MTLSERYRAQAAWARDQADRADTPELRERWLNLAREYDRLASDNELQKRP